MAMNARAAKGAVVLCLSVAMVGASASMSAADEAIPEGFESGSSDSTSALTPTSYGLQIAVNDDVIEWAQDRLGLEEVSIRAAAEERAAYMTRGLRTSERSLLSRGSRIGVTVDVANQQITKVVDRDAPAGITPFALTISYGCTDNANNKSCVFVNAPGSNVAFTGASGNSWASLGYAHKTWRWFSPKNMVGTMTLVTPFLGNYTYALPADSYMNFTVSQTFNGMKHG